MVCAPRSTSDLTSPVRERRIAAIFERGTAVGHYALAADDDHAQLTVSVDGHHDRAVFRDDALSACLVQAYRDQTAADEFALARDVVRLLATAKHRTRDLAVRGG